MTFSFPSLDRAAREPLAAQIATYFASAIRRGQLRAGERLPPIRDVARECGVTRATVQEAYRRLAADGLVEGIVGRGTTVLEGVATTRAAGSGAARSGGSARDVGAGGGPGDGRAGSRAGADATRSGRSLSSFATAALQRTLAMPGAPELASGQRLVANFAELLPDSARFPVDEWRQTLDAVLRRGPEVLGYGGSANGLPELRAAFAERAQATDPGTTAEEVLITGGAQQALDLALRTFCAPGDAVVVTDPSYHQMFGLLEAHGLEAVALRWRREGDGVGGLDLDQLATVLRRPRVRLVYLMPTFHNPTGRTLDLEQRRALVDLVKTTDVPIVEDEYQQSLRFRGEALPSLRSLDPRGLTVTVASVSKELFPALRIGSAIGSESVLEPMAAVKRFVDLETSPLLQAALVEFLARGSFDAYLSDLRVELARRHAALVEAAERHLPPECSLTRPDGGFLAWLELPQPGQADRLVELASERGVRVVAGRAFYAIDRPSTGVRLSLTRADSAEIAAGMAVLGECARTILAGPAVPSFL